MDVGALRAATVFMFLHTLGGFGFFFNIKKCGLNPLNTILIAIHKNQTH